MDQSPQRTLAAATGDSLCPLNPTPLCRSSIKKLDVSNFREQHWEGTFWDYLDIVHEHPAVCRNAFQRVYDMILSYGSESFNQFKQELNRYKFFADPIDHGADAIYGLERPLMQLVDFFKSAAQGYGTEKRILLLHGPVGSSKSTIARLLKKGLEALQPNRCRATASPTCGAFTTTALAATKASNSSNAPCTKSRCC